MAVQALNDGANCSNRNSGPENLELSFGFVRREAGTLVQKSI